MENINKSHERANSIFDVLEMLVLSTCIIMLIFTFLVRVCRVDGESMEDTLFHGELLLVSNVAYTPDIGDIVVFHQIGGGYQEPIVKRVIATEGEWVDIDFDTWTVTIYDKNQENPRVLEEPYRKLSGIKRTSSLTYPVQVPEGKLFVMGDNRYHSTDSRFDAIGFVDARRVFGKVIFRITPWNRMGVVD